jgi:GNAT superfamily N-acetyltransferase
VNAGYELRAYEPEHKQDYLGLLGEAWGDGAMTEAEFDWWFDGNPAGSLRSVAVLDERVVGVAGHSLYRMVLGGEECLATFSVHATTHESARGRGIFAALERKHEEEAQELGAAVVLAFASEPTAPIFLGPLGWTEIAQLRVWARPLPSIGTSASPTVDVLGDGADAAASWPNHVIRGETFLHWRYLSSPKGYCAVASPGGYAVVGRKRRGGQTAATVVDLVGEGVLRAALSQAGECRVALALPSRSQRKTFAALGFVPTTYTLHFIGKALAGRLDTDSTAWRFTLGDTDFF